MAFTKCTDPVDNITNQPNQPIIGATALKALFDEIGKDLKAYLNNTLTTELESTTDGDSGADNIGATSISGLSGTSVQALLESLKLLVDTQLPFPDGSITNNKLATDVKVGSLAALNTIDKDSVTDAINEIDSILKNYGYPKYAGGGFTLATDDANKVIYVGGGGTVTVPTDLTVNFPLGTKIKVVSYTSSTINFTNAVGVTLDSYNGFRTIKGLYAAAILTKIASNTWVLDGDISSVVTTINSGFASGWSGTVKYMIDQEDGLRINLKDMVKTSDITNYEVVYTFPASLNLYVGASSKPGFTSANVIVNDSIITFLIENGNLIASNHGSVTANVRKLFGTTIMATK